MRMRSRRKLNSNRDPWMTMRAAAVYRNPFKTFGLFLLVSAKSGNRSAVNNIDKVMKVANTLNQFLPNYVK